MEAIIKKMNTKLIHRYDAANTQLALDTFYYEYVSITLLW